MVIWLLSNRLCQHLRKACTPAGVLTLKTRLHELITQSRRHLKSGRHQTVPGMLSKLTEKHELGAGITLTERMHHIQLIPQLSELTHKLLTRKTRQVVLGRQPAVEPVSLLQHRLTCREIPVPLLAHTRIPKTGSGTLLTSPLIHVLEEETVNRLHMRKIEIAADRLLSQQEHATAHFRLFELLELSGVSFAVRFFGAGEKVPKNARSGDVVVAPLVVLRHYASPIMCRVVAASYSSKEISWCASWRRSSWRWGSVMTCPARFMPASANFRDSSGVMGLIESSVWVGLAAIGFLSRWTHPDGSGMQKCRKLYMRFSVLATSDGGSAQGQKRLSRKD
ncbi:Rhs family protein [Rothia mucilaginosa DY-18]|uniref:Rhs family protein n=1 Tax=Rothia mucilaginosa (strain DY-18) TaxID=680646 RepID=D2NQM2_ROTMD|nr:Rhs family protein [Rothia mucilaginosa DY-18]